MSERVDVPGGVTLDVDAVVARLDGCRLTRRGDAPMTVQVLVAGGQEWWWRHQDGRLTAATGRTADADLVISTDGAQASRLVAGVDSASESFLLGRVDIAGDLRLAKDNAELLVAVSDALAERSEHTSAQAAPFEEPASGDA